MQARECEQQHSRRALRALRFRVLHLESIKNVNLRGRQTHFKNEIIRGAGNFKEGNKNAGWLTNVKINSENEEITKLKTTHARGGNYEGTNNTQEARDRTVKRSRVESTTEGATERNVK